MGLDLPGVVSFISEEFHSMIQGRLSGVHCVILGKVLWLQLSASYHFRSWCGDKICFLSVCTLHKESWVDQERMPLA